MYNFSNEAKQRILSGKITRAYLKVLETDTEPEIIIDESNYLKDLTFEELRYVPDEGFIGGTVAKRVTGNLNNVDSTFSIQDREFELYMGVDLENGTTEYIKYGTFIVQKPEDNQVTDNTSFEALDYMIKLNLPWTDRMTYPCTLKQLFDDLVAQSGLSTTVTSFLNQDFIVENNQFEEGTTRRDVLKAIAQMAFNWARIDENNSIVMDFEKKDDIAETLTVDDYYNFSKQDAYGPINVIVLRNSQVEGENVTIKDEESIKAGKGKNKFDKDNIKYIEGYYLNDSGEEVEDENWQYTDYIKVDTYNITLSKISDELPSICGYDENKNFIKGAKYNNQSSVTLSSTEKIKYVRFSVKKDWLTYKENYHTLNFPIFIGDYPYVGNIQLEYGKEETEYESFIPNGETELVIADNPFAYAQEKRQELIGAGSSLFGLTYVPMSMDMIGYIYLNCKDKIRATNLNNETFDTYLLNHTITYEGTVTDSMEAPAMTKTETQYKFTSPMAQALRHTEILVDKANQRIDAIIENVTENSEKIVELELNLDGITSTVSNIETNIETIETNVQTAQTTANNANSTAQSAQTIAESAQTAAENAQTTANNAKSTADNVSLQLTTTNQNLSQVQQTVNGITQTVSSIEETVAEVEDKADNAQNTANSINNNLTNNYYTKTQTDSEIQQTANTINLSIQQITTNINNIENEQEEQSNLITQISASLEGIEQTVSNIQNLTDTVQGEKTITLNNCAEGSVLELHILGNNEVFENLYPANNLYPSNTLYPSGDSRIVVTTENNTTTYELGVTDVLRKNGNTYDEYVLENGQAKIIRRINENGTIKTTPTTEDLGEFSINLGEGTNTITIKNYSATISAKFAIQNDYTDIFATKVEMSSSITQTAEEITSEVNKKVGEEEFGTLIQQNAYNVKIAWNNNTTAVQFEGNGISLYDGGISENNKRAVFDFEGNRFYNNGYYVGAIQTNSWEKDFSHKGLVFSLNSQGKYMSWEERESDTTNYQAKLCYSRANSIYTEEGLHLGTDLYGHWFTLNNFHIGSISAGGYTAFNGEIPIVTEIITDNGNYSYHMHSKLQVRNGIIVGYWN